MLYEVITPLDPALAHQQGEEAGAAALANAGEEAAADLEKPVAIEGRNNFV